MTTTETDAPAEETPDTPPADADAPTPGDDSGEAPPAEPPALDAGGPTRNEPLWTRGILPLALPFLSMLALAIWVINLSRTFITGGKEGALVIVMVVTITIMAGAALMSAAKRMRTGSSTMLVATLLMVVVTAGIITLGPSESHGEGEAGPTYQEPKGPAVATLDVVAGPGTKFDSDSYTLSTSGIIEIIYEGQSGHTLAFKDQEYNGFLLKSPGPDKGKADLPPGEYTIYCTIAGHEAGGMVATVNVPEASTQPEPTTTTTAASS